MGKENAHVRGHAVISRRPRGLVLDSGGRVSADRLLSSSSAVPSGRARVVIVGQASFNTLVGVDG